MSVKLAKLFWDFRMSCFTRQTITLPLHTRTNSACREWSESVGKEMFPAWSVGSEHTKTLGLQGIHHRFQGVGSYN